jgi:colanic acid/amylovoran biosynthesis protein
MFGAAGDSGNLGVSALLNASVTGLARREPQAQLTVFDNGWGVRQTALPMDHGDFEYSLCGARLSRRYYRPESFWMMRMSNHLGGLGNPGMRSILDADAVWDISGGDSFTDLYGKKRFTAIVRPKELALAAGTPLVLLPQTYGPFEHHANREQAASLIRKCRMAWARDADSFLFLQEILGDDFDADRHRLGVDMAFLLDKRRPQDLPEPIVDWLSAQEEAPLVGLNVSGLLYGQPDARQQFGLRADYDRVIRDLLGRLLAESSANVALIAHVLGTSAESDTGACKSLVEHLSPDDRRRVVIVDKLKDPREIKWLVSRLSWFCGTRMHSTIAGLSSGVPTAAIAYSMKTKGVFDTCGQGNRVADPREFDTDQVTTALWSAWSARVQDATALAAVIPRVQTIAQGQLDEIVQASRGTKVASR